MILFYLAASGFGFSCKYLISSSKKHICIIIRHKTCMPLLKTCSKHWMCVCVWVCAFLCRWTWCSNNTHGILFTMRCMLMIDKLVLQNQYIHVYAYAFGSLWVQKMSTFSCMHTLHWCQEYVSGSANISAGWDVAAHCVLLNVAKPTMPTLPACLSTCVYSAQIASIT